MRGRGGVVGGGGLWGEEGRGDGEAASGEHGVGGGEVEEAMSGGAERHGESESFGELVGLLAGGRRQETEVAEASEEPSDAESGDESDGGGVEGAREGLGGADAARPFRPVIRSEYSTCAAGRQAVYAVFFTGAASAHRRGGAWRRG